MHDACQLYVQKCIGILYRILLVQRDDFSTMLGTRSPKPSLSFTIRVEYALFIIAVFFAHGIMQIVAVCYSFIIFS